MCCVFDFTEVRIKMVILAFLKAGLEVEAKDVTFEPAALFDFGRHLKGDTVGKGKKILKGDTFWNCLLTKVLKKQRKRGKKKTKVKCILFL